MSFLSASFSSEATIRQRLPAGAASLLRIPVTGEYVRHKERWGGRGERMILGKKRCYEMKTGTEMRKEK